MNRNGPTVLIQNVEEAGLMLRGLEERDGGILVFHLNLRSIHRNFDGIVS